MIPFSAVASKFDGASYGAFLTGFAGLLTALGTLLHRKIRDSQRDKAYEELLRIVNEELANCHKERERQDTKISKLTTHLIALERGWAIYDRRVSDSPTSFPDRRRESIPRNPDSWQDIVKYIRKEIAVAQLRDPLPHDSDTQFPHDAASENRTDQPPSTP